VDSPQRSVDINVITSISFGIRYAQIAARHRKRAAPLGGTAPPCRWFLRQSQAFRESRPCGTFPQMGRGWGAASSESELEPKVYLSRRVDAGDLAQGAAGFL